MLDWTFNDVGDNDMVASPLFIGDNAEWLIAELNSWVINCLNSSNCCWNCDLICSFIASNCFAKDRLSYANCWLRLVVT